MTTLDFMDIWNILETYFKTENIDLINYEQNINFLYVEALIDGRLVQMTIDPKTRRLKTATGHIEIKT
jgi:DNA-directed RNA polymerase delta subunit